MPWWYLGGLKSPRDCEARAVGSASTGAGFSPPPSSDTPLLRGWMRDEQGLNMSLESTGSLLSLLFLLGIVMLIMAPETKGKELPE